MILGKVKLFVSIALSFALVGCGTPKAEDVPTTTAAPATGTIEDVSGKKEKVPVATDENLLKEKPKEVPKEEVEEVKEEVEDKVKDPLTGDLSNTYPKVPLVTSKAVGYNDSKSWWFNRTDSGNPPTAQGDIAILDYDAYYLGDTSKKVIYLTFDEGYEMGFTPTILDVLKANDVEATFFLTSDFIKTQPELSKRIAEEGHTAANHSATHPKMSTISDEKIVEELEACAKLFQETTGYELAPFFRPPAGEYSVRTLEKVQAAGYKTIFWSFAYKDWLVDEQPGEETAYNMVMKYSHNGCIMLLHAVSQSNTQALDRMLKSLKEEGYVFESLYNLPATETIKEAIGNKQ